MSSGVRIYSVSDDYSGGSMTNATIPEEFKKISMGRVVLERHVIVGSGSIILPGVHVTEGCAIGALSLVNQSTDPWGVYAGIPVLRLRDRSRALLSLETKFLGRAK